MSKSIIKNSMYNMVYKGFNIVYPLLTSAYISRILLAKGVGDVAFSLNIVTYFTMVASLGIPNYAVKVLTTVRDEKEGLNASFSELATVISYSSVLATVTYYVVVLFLIRPYIVNLQASLILGLILPSNIVNYDWLFESMEDYKYIAIRTMGVKLVSLVLLFVFVKQADDTIIYIAIYTGTLVITNLCNGIASRKYVSFTAQDLHVIQHLKSVLVLFAASCATEIYTLMDSTMLGVVCESKYLGYYSNATRTVRAAYGLLIAAVAVYYPRLSYIYSNGNQGDYKAKLTKCYNSAMYISIPATVGMFSLARNIIIVIFSNDFTPAAVTLQILSLLIPVFILATIFGHVALVIYGKERQILLATIAGAIINFTLNSLLIPSMQHNGAALGSLVSELSVTTILVVSSMKIFKIPLFNKSIRQTLLASCIMLAVDYGIQSFVTQPVVKIIAVILGSITCYIFVTIAMGNEIIRELCKKIKPALPKR